LRRALATEFNSAENDKETLLVRGALDDFISGLSIFQSHIDTGLIKLEDIRPYLEYWVGELTGKGRIQTNPDVGRHVARYLRYYGYERVLTLARNMGYPFDDPPQDEAQNSKSKAST
jgi:hypothetical protein